MLALGIIAIVMIYSLVLIVSGIRAAINICSQGSRTRYERTSRTMASAPTTKVTVEGQTSDGEYWLESGNGVLTADLD